ncbi:DUF2270 domain-containing protein [Candidatus Fermentibacteria bacterium]|nr:DUF2270 domain-containing protein [Candidatus Fermentibacteria bacterium]
MEDSRLPDHLYYTTMVHFYRGELGRIMSWRERLDTTTNWAVASATALMSVGLSRGDVPHIVFLMANFVIFLLLSIEGRRYRYYDAFRARVRMLEAHFLVPVLMRDSRLLEGDWRRTLSEDLLLPSFKINRREAIGRRLTRNYIWIFLIILVAWIAKIHLRNTDSTGLAAFLYTAQQGQPLPAILFWVLVGAFYGLLAYLMIVARLSRRASGEFKRQSVKPTEWSM